MTHEFVSLFGHEPAALSFSPARVNLIGEHIDYCGGLVLPMAIGQGTGMLFRRNGERLIRIFSTRFDEMVEVDLDALPPKAGSWRDLVLGLAVLLPTIDQGADILVQQDAGSAGLSSSASFCVALALIFGGGKLPGTALARLCQQVEHEYAGVNCGVMDQMSVISGGVIKLDCQDLDHQSCHPDFSDVAVVVLDTGKARTLAASGYNKRVAELTQIAALPGMPAVHALAPSRVSGEGLPSLLQKRLRHVQSEHQRVIQAFDCLARCDWQALGRLMIESHISLKHDYEVSCKELDLMVDLVLPQAGVHGARMTGGGFGGCAICLADRDAIDDWMPAVRSRYAQETGLNPRLMVVEQADGAAIRPL